MSVKNISKHCLSLTGKAIDWVIMGALLSDATVKAEDRAVRRQRQLGGDTNYRSLVLSRIKYAHNPHAHPDLCASAPRAVY